MVSKLKYEEGMRDTGTLKQKNNWIYNGNGKDMDNSNAQMQACNTCRKYAKKYMEVANKAFLERIPGRTIDVR